MPLPFGYRYPDPRRPSSRSAACLVIPFVLFGASSETNNCLILKTNRYQDKIVLTLNDQKYFPNDQVCFYDINLFLMIVILVLMLQNTESIS